MAGQQGTLHIKRTFYTTENQGVYDVTFTRDDRPEAEDRPIIRRFEDDQELADFLLKHLHRDANEIRKIMQRLAEEEHADISNLQMEQDELRQLKLAA